MEAITGQMDNKTLHTSTSSGRDMDENESSNTAMDAMDGILREGVPPATSPLNNCPPSANQGSAGEENVSGESSSADCSDLDSEEEKELEREMALWKRIEKLRMKIEESHMQRMEKKMKSRSRGVKHRGTGRNRRLERFREMSDFHHPPPTLPMPLYLLDVHRCGDGQNLVTANGPPHLNRGYHPGHLLHPRGYGPVGPPADPRFPLVPGANFLSPYSNAVEDSHMMMPPPPPYPGFGPFHPSFHPVRSPEMFGYKRINPSDRKAKKPKDDKSETGGSGPYENWVPWHQHLSEFDEGERKKH